MSCGSQSLVFRIQYQRYVNPHSHDWYMDGLNALSSCFNTLGIMHDCKKSFSRIHQNTFLLCVGQSFGLESQTPTSTGSSLFPAIDGRQINSENVLPNVRITLQTHFFMYSTLFAHMKWYICIDKSQSPDGSRMSNRGLDSIVGMG